jgi:hypothetical protein
MSQPLNSGESKQGLAGVEAVVDQCLHEISMATGWVVPVDRCDLIRWVERLLARAYPAVPPISSPAFWRDGANLYTFEEREPGSYTLFLGRGAASHGYNLCRVSNFDHMGTQTRKAILLGLNQLRYTATLEHVMQASIPALPPELAERFRKALDLKPPPKD